MDGDRSNTVAVFSMERYKFLSLDIVCLVLVSCHENDFVTREEVDVVTLHRWNAENAVKGKVAP